MKKSRKKRTDKRDVLRKVRKPMPKPTKVINPKKRYDRRDTSWKEEVDDG